MKPTLSVDPAGQVGVTTTVRVTFVVTRIEADYDRLPAWFSPLRPLLEWAVQTLLAGRLTMDVASSVSIDGAPLPDGHQAERVPLARPIAHDVTTRATVPECCGAAWARGRSEIRDALSPANLVRRN